MTNHLTKSLLAIFLFAVTFASCTKDEEGDPTDEFQTPTEISLSNSTIYEKLPEGSVVAFLSSDVSEPGMQYKFTAGEGDSDNNDFKINGTTLSTNSVLQFSDGATRSIRVQVVNGTKTLEKAAVITVNEFTGTYPSISSPSFEDDGQMPSEFGGDNENISPDLDIMDIPDNTETMALTMIDLDFSDAWHWAVWNIPATKTSINKNQVWTGGAVVGDVDFGSGYVGPFPPSEHRYKISVYFLDSSLDLNGSEYKLLPKAVAGKTIAQASMIGRFTP
ncbi:MAG TPA: YbhB/YbcL family Raf kinase inhibitor-like protein [Bacteroidetes bacterium]|nr:YbhB/YbcL family Raf kinase inhibitor-like protein [Bacteroidota bacterium]